jgi:asparagine synthase (glutamine-hydrolysing)
MSGICALWRRDNEGSVRPGIESVLRQLSVTGSETATWEAEAGYAGVGAAARFATQQVGREREVSVACDADLLNLRELWESVGEVWAESKASQTAILLARLYLKAGPSFVEKLAGGFSVVLWDGRSQRLIAAVDPFGSRRLVYCEEGPMVAVASRIDALRMAAGSAAGINPRAIANILNFSASLGPETVFKGVLRIPPAAQLIASRTALKVYPYWDMRYDSRKAAGEGELSRQLWQVVEKSVAANAAGPPAEVGAFLSGGTDSSTIVGLMARHAKDPVKAYSIGFQEESFDELRYARIAAERFQAAHRTHLVGPRDCAAALPAMVRAFDEPFGNSSAIPTYFCARLAAEDGVRVLLGGDGGDELFGGNEWYRIEKIFDLYRSVPAPLRNGLIEPLLAGLPFSNGVVGKARSYVRRAKTPGIERAMSYHFLCSHSLPEIFSADFLEALGEYSVLDMPRRYYDKAPARDHMNRLLYVDMKIVIGDSDLPKVTQMAELAGVQVRFPFLDRPVAEFTGGVPATLKVKGLKKRYLFKRAFRDLLPREIITKTKHGFGIPVATWLKSDPELRACARDTLLSQRAHERGYFKRPFIEELFRKHESDATSYYGDTLWSFLMIELWHREHVDQALGAAV